MESRLQPLADSQQQLVRVSLQRLNAKMDPAEKHTSKNRLQQGCIKKGSVAMDTLPVTAVRSSRIFVRLVCFHWGTATLSAVPTSGRRVTSDPEFDPSTSRLLFVLQMSPHVSTHRTRAEALGCVHELSTVF